VWGSSRRPHRGTGLSGPRRGSVRSGVIRFHAHHFVMTIDPYSGTDPCQIGRKRLYQTVLQLLPGSAVVSPPISNVGGTGEHDQLFAKAEEMCSLPVGLDSHDRVAECPLNIAWWTLTAHAFEVIRANPIPANPLPPLSEAEILENGRPTSVLKARAILSDTTARQTVRVFDIGRGNSFAWRGPNVDLRTLTNPVRALGGPSADTPQGLIGATIVDTLVQFSASPVVWGTALSKTGALVFTQIVNVAPGVLTCIPIPEGARTVQWFQVGGPAISPSWSIQFGPAPTTILLGLMPGVSSVFPQSVPGSGPTDLCFVLGGVATVQITFVWELTV
ncbi:hypothetical protein LCGC14_2832930, partial [marine sediment metagenome]